ncbi:ATP synthase subunit I [Pseudomonas sp.]|uniref:N-ATPase subunit AtpR n=1 Tax=Pseudomonas sp. TaxID=306 RepID=UPI003D0F1463
MSDLFAFPQFWHAGAGLTVGTLAGLLHFHFLALNVRLFTKGRAGAALLLQLLRLAVTASVLIALARLGAAAVLAGAVGVLLARQWMLRRQRGAP